MSELRSAIDEYRSEALGELPDSRADEDFAELQRAIQALEAERVRRLADLDRRGCYRRDGHLSTVSWLVPPYLTAGLRRRSPASSINSSGTSARKREGSDAC